MNISKSLLLSVLLALPAFAAEGVPGATIANDAAKPPYGSHGAIVAACRADPEKCKEMKARTEQRRAQCQADPEKCRQEMQARREQFCAQNAERCREMKARMEQRRAQCRADPEKCRQEREARMDERFRKADADGNGMLSRAEAEKGAPMLARHFEAIDADRDGQVSRAELTTARKARQGSKPQRKS